MSLSYDTACRLVEQGEFGELRRLAEPHLGNEMLFEPRVLVMVAHALVYTGESGRALSLLSILDLESKTTRFNRSRARLVLGLANRSAGSMTKALSDFQKALHVAQQAESWGDVAWAHVHLFRHVIDSHPSDLAPAMLPAVRAAATRAGSPSLFAFLHVCVAVMEGHNGRLREALRHCARAESLLASAANAWIQCGIQQNRAAILGAQCRFVESLEILESLRQAALLHGLTNDAIKAEASIGHVLWMTGEHDRAIETLEGVIGAQSTSRLSSLYALESIAQAHLWKGNFHRCDEALTRIELEASRDAELASNYSVRRTTMTRARLFLRMNRTDEALEYLAQADHDRGATDAMVAAGLSILRCEALARRGRFVEAGRQLCRADESGATAIRELQGRFYEAAASTVGTSASGLAGALAQRAAKVWGVQGTGWMQGQVPVVTSATGGLSASEAINRVSSTIDLAYDPRLATDEAISLLKSLGCVARACKSTDGPEVPFATSELGVIPLGNVDGESWWLEYRYPSEPAANLVLRDIGRVVRAAFALEDFKTSAHSRAAAWPPEHESAVDGPLFLSQEMRNLADTATRVAATDVPILLTGETGTGKEVLARLIHSRSLRAKKPFLPFNCTTVPREMMDSQLFGHRRGAFTGAIDSFQGVIRGARGGTLLLDEIGDLGLESQPKLLRFLESGEVLPLGESAPVQADVRVIAATNVDLQAAVSNGRFREDLYYRLNIVQLRVPPLRQRRAEIPSLSRHYLEAFATQFEKGDLRLTEEAMEHLVLFSWPGNVRQLANEMRRLAALAEADSLLTVGALSPEIFQARSASLPGPRVDTNQVAVRLDQSMADAVESVERAMLVFAMKRHQGRVEAVAKALGLSRKGLYLKRQRYGLEELGQTGTAQP